MENVLVKNIIVKDLIVTDPHSRNSIKFPLAYTRDAIPVNHDHIPTLKL